MSEPKAEAKEARVAHSTPMQPDYIFVAKGNSYVTRHCRLLTQVARQPVYVDVDDATRKPLGIRVPTRIHNRVINLELASRLDRKRTVEKHDASLEKAFQTTIAERFPGIPKTRVLPIIVKHAMEKHTGRVGRTSTKNIAQKANLAVQAHIRHNYTTYDQLFRQGYNQAEAREATIDQTLDIMGAWRWPRIRESGRQPVGTAVQRTSERVTSRSARGARKKTRQPSNRVNKRTANTTEALTEPMAQRTGGQLEATKNIGLDSQAPNLNRQSLSLPCHQQPPHPHMQPVQRSMGLPVPRQQPATCTIGQCTTVSTTSPKPPINAQTAPRNPVCCQPQDNNDQAHPQKTSASPAGQDLANAKAIPCPPVQQQPSGTMPCTAAERSMCATTPLGSTQAEPFIIE
ncbi:hypothetical protein F4778DRAFT_783587 [Xylariomycetidae sp. FL2044]|nr:hypothetical protein F4778DRAFT_783587 [Xylariomycetidae sp. FL2044]